LRAAEPLHEPLFYLERLEARRPLAFRLRSGEDIVGTVAWYDRDAVRVDGADGSHLILLKHAIKHVADAG
jgi:sRNA-binding regulator protein Hfq